jgi:uncharacterized protein YeaO (DUF488 family)
MNTIQIKRIYESPAESDGHRILIDRLWPRGISKEKAHIEQWAKEIAPSPQLRQAYHKNTMSYADFMTAYTAELNQNQPAAQFADTCKTKLSTANITLLYGRKNTTENNAVILLSWLYAVINTATKK